MLSGLRGLEARKEGARLSAGGCGLGKGVSQGPCRCQSSLPAATPLPALARSRSPSPVAQSRRRRETAASNQRTFFGRGGLCEQPLGPIFCRRAC